MKVNKNLVANKKAPSISEGASLSCVAYLCLQGGPEFIPVYLIYAALLRSDYELAENYFRQSLHKFSDFNEKMGIPECFEGLASVFAVTNRVEGVARLAAAVGVIRDLIAAQALPLDRDSSIVCATGTRAHHPGGLGRCMGGWI
jgi:hypothetical protein